MRCLGIRMMRGFGLGSRMKKGFNLGSRTKRDFDHMKGNIKGHFVR